MSNNEIIIKQTDRVNSLIVTNEDEMNNAHALGKQIKEYYNQVIATRDDVLKPILESEKKIRGQYKPFEQKCTDAIAIIKSKIKEFKDAEDARKAKELAKIIARVNKGTIRDDTATNKIIAIEESMPDTKGKSAKIPKYRVLDISLIPKEYLEVNMTMVRESYRNGGNVPGIEQYYETSIRF